MAETVDRRGERIDYTAPRGHHMIDTLTLRDAAGALLDMSLYTVRFRVWPQGSSEYTSPGTVTEGTGTVQIKLSPADIAALGASNLYDVALVDLADEVAPAFWGSLNFTGVDV